MARSIEILLAIDKFASKWDMESMMPKVLEAGKQMLQEQ